MTAAPTFSPGDLSQGHNEEAGIRHSPSCVTRLLGGPCGPQAEALYTLQGTSWVFMWPCIHHNWAPFLGQGTVLVKPRGDSDEIGQSGLSCLLLVTCFLSVVSIKLKATPLNPAT